MPQSGRTMVACHFNGWENGATEKGRAYRYATSILIAYLRHAIICLNLTYQQLK